MAIKKMAIKKNGDFSTPDKKKNGDFPTSRPPLFWPRKAFKTGDLWFTKRGAGVIQHFDKEGRYILISDVNRPPGAVNKAFESLPLLARAIALRRFACRTPHALSGAL